MRSLSKVVDEVVIIGAVLIVSSGALYGFYKVLEESQKLKGYTLLISVIFDVIELIQYRKLKTDEIIFKLRGDKRYESFKTLEIFVNEISRGEDISFACERSFIDDCSSPYEKELYKILKVIGRDSLQTQIEKLIFLKNGIEQIVATKKEEYAKNKKLYTTLSFGISFILVLMLI